MHRRDVKVHVLTTSLAALLCALMAACAGTETTSELVANSPDDCPAVITITAVKGLAQVRSVEDAAWTPAEVAMKLPLSAEYRLAPRASMQFRMPDGKTETRDRLGTGRFTDTRPRPRGRDLHYATIRAPSLTLQIRSPVYFWSGRILPFGASVDTESAPAPPPFTLPAKLDLQPDPGQSPTLFPLRNPDFLQPQPHHTPCPVQLNGGERIRLEPMPGLPLQDRLDR